ncbi:MAG: YifB family Mg chelatase-like AAA ATPase [Endomicrobia bacterium]|nr:YifB family Mg chelatase-like AAA ATPase [Endomicrobiia bacterium]MCL2506913.1 YifB family Mg chelatase-like AAA ATPase [Endomicrobiia bacterium]
MISLIYSAAINGIDANLIEVETYISSGMPVFSIVGLPDAAVKESRDRVVAALKNSGFDFPSKRITVNLAPADIKKEGGSFDLPIALGILSSCGKINKDKLKCFCASGELALDGSIRKVKGILPIALGLKKNGIKSFIIPFLNKEEAAVAKDISVYPFKNLSEVVKFINGEIMLEPFVYDVGSFDESVESEYDFADIKGQLAAKRAAEIAAAGSHNIIMSGPPGSGKTMIAKRISGILPNMSFDESVETTKIWSASGHSFSGGLIKQRTFRNPHHTASAIALAGGGNYPKPGEVSLAHNGVLFLDEFAEFRRDALEILRQPLEDKQISVSRAKSSITFPASFMLVAAMNPCPCGNLGHREKQCSCNPYQVQKYKNKISGPLLDRIDIHIEVPALKVSELAQMNASGESSSEIRKRVVKAREKQTERFKKSKIYANAQMSAKDIKKFCVLDEKAEETLKTAIEKFNFSARAYDRILKVARTIADLENSETIKSGHIAEAIRYRSLDR